MSLSELGEIKKISTSDIIVERIKSMIISETYKPGDKLPSERELAAIFSVSRPTVREAMKQLQSQGLVDIRTGDGTYINESVNILPDRIEANSLLGHYKYSELIEARKILEAGILEKASESLLLEKSESIAEAFKEFEAIARTKDVEVEQIIKADISFHLEIAEAMGNQFLYEMLNVIVDLTIKMNTTMLQKKNVLINEIVNDHEAIMNAISEGNPKLASDRMQDHLDNIRDALKELEMI